MYIHCTILNFINTWGVVTEKPRRMWKKRKIFYIWNTFKTKIRESTYVRVYSQQDDNNILVSCFIPVLINYGCIMYIFISVFVFAYGIWFHIYNVFIGHTRQHKQIYYVQLCLDQDTPALAGRLLFPIFWHSILNYHRHILCVPCYNCHALF